MSTTSDEPIRQSEIDPVLESYQNFYDHDAARKLLALVDGTQLNQPVYSLCANWKAASNTMRLPWLTVHSLEQFGQGLSKGNSFVAKLVDAIAHQLPKRIGSILKPIQRLTMESEIHKIAEGVRDAERITDKTVITRQNFWGVFLDPNNNEFRMAIWGSQRIAYSAAYFAYENFIQECVGVLKGDLDYKMMNVDAMKRDVLQELGPPIIDLCVTDSEVNTARLVRNDLAHNGGKPGEKLKKIAHGIVVSDDGILQIRAEDNHRLMKLLHDRAYQFAEAVLAKIGGVNCTVS